MLPINRDPAALCPKFAELVGRFIQAWNLNHPEAPISLFEGLRVKGRQAELYAQGRSAPGKIVTNAPEGMSWHCYGLAADLVFDADPVKPGLQWTWDGKMPWPQMGAMAISMGLEWAGNWKFFKEYPHVQQTYGLQITEAHALYQSGGLLGVWATL